MGISDHAYLKCFPAKTKGPKKNNTVLPSQNNCPFLLLKVKNISFQKLWDVKQVYSKAMLYFNSYKHTLGCDFYDNGSGSQPPSHNRILNRGKQIWRID